MEAFKKQATRLREQVAKQQQVIQLLSYQLFLFSSSFFTYTSEFLFFVYLFCLAGNIEAFGTS
jgi:hypothetical protein